MKKIISFVVGALMLSTAAWADSYVVDNKGDFGIAWNAIGKTVGQKDTIIVTASMGGRKGTSSRFANRYRYLYRKCF